MINLIAARAKNGVIGSKGKIPWQLPEDVTFFREHVAGQVVIMGQKVYESFPEIKDIAQMCVVITSSPEKVVQGFLPASSIEDAIRQTKSYSDDAWVIGGGYTYKTAMPYADGLYLTEIDHEYPGDAYFPEFSDQDFKLVTSAPGVSATFAYPFSFNYYERNR